MIFAVDGETVQVVDGRRVHDLPIAEARSRTDLHVPVVADPPGRLLSRIATISDMHVGEPGFGVFPRVHEAEGVHEGRYTVRAMKAAITEALAWGAEALIVKGDITWSGRPRQWEAACAVLAEVPVPVMAAVGNHDVVVRGQPGRPWLADAGIDMIVDREDPIAVHDVAGLRIVLANTTEVSHGPGRVPPREQRHIAEALAAAPSGGALLALHHYPNRFGRTTRYPPGIRQDEGDGLLAHVVESATPTLMTCGHTHRHRRYRRGGVEITEVGSTKDFPGVWAGYAIHEGGIRQVVRRIGEPSVVTWTDTTRRACLGLWGYWTPGRFAWRCFSSSWDSLRRSP